MVFQSFVSLRANLVRPSLKLHGAWAVGLLGSIMEVLVLVGVVLNLRVISEFFFLEHRLIGICFGCRL